MKFGAIIRGILAIGLVALGLEEGARLVSSGIETTEEEMVHRMESRHLLDKYGQVISITSSASSRSVLGGAATPGYYVIDVRNPGEESRPLEAGSGFSAECYAWRDGPSEGGGHCKFIYL